MPRSRPLSVIHGGVKLDVKNIIVVPYDAAWRTEFEKIKEQLLAVLDGKVLRIEHVGSTSVPGLAAKPIIDLDVVIENYGVFEGVKIALQTLGYAYEGDLGIPGREAFAYRPEEKPDLMEHHLYVCPQDSPELKRHTTFRDHLRNNADDRERYAQIKRQAAQRYPHDIEGYLEMKGTVIAEIYKKCGLI